MTDNLKGQRGGGRWSPMSLLGAALTNSTCHSTWAEVQYVACWWWRNKKKALESSKWVKFSMWFLLKISPWLVNGDKWMNTGVLPLTVAPRRRRTLPHPVEFIVPLLTPVSIQTKKLCSRHAVAPSYFLTPIVSATPVQNPSTVTCYQNGYNMISLTLEFPTISIEYLYITSQCTPWRRPYESEFENVW